MKKKKLKTFEYTVIAYRTVIVEAESRSDAESRLSDEATDFDWTIDEFQFEGELKTPEQIEASERHNQNLNDW